MAIFDDDTRREVLRQWRDSGLPSHEFARACGVSHATLYKWRRELRPQFVEIAADGAVLPTRVEISAPIEVALPGGAIVRVSGGFDAATLRAVVEALSHASRPTSER
jgi:hypothetical protein